MDILVVSATCEEIVETWEYFSTAQRPEIGILQQVMAGSGNLGFLVTGVGVPLTMAHTALAAKEKSWDLIINAGIAGSFKEKYEPGLVGLVVQETFGDLGFILNGNFATVWEKGLGKAGQFPFKNGIIELNIPEWAGIPDHLIRLKGTTVNAMNAGIIEKSDFFRRYDPDLESMEGAGVALFAALNGPDCIELRCVSNYTTEPDSKKWKMDLAISSLNRELIGLLQLLIETHL